MGQYNPAHSLRLTGWMIEGKVASGNPVFRARAISPAYIILSASNTLVPQTVSLRITI